MNNMKNEIKIGDTVRADNHGWVGTVVGSAFGKPEKGKLRVQLSFGLSHDFYPSELTKTDPPVISAYERKRLEEGRSP